MTVCALAVVSTLAGCCRRFPCGKASSGVACALPSCGPGSPGVGSGHSSRCLVSGASGLLVLPVVSWRRRYSALALAWRPDLPSSDQDPCKEMPSAHTYVHISLSSAARKHCLQGAREDMYPVVVGCSWHIVGAASGRRIFAGMICENVGHGAAPCVKCHLPIQTPLQEAEGALQ